MLIKLCYIIILISTGSAYGGADFTQKSLESVNDFTELSEAIQDSEKEARAATVCIDLGDGASGSGVIVSPEGLVMSAAHVTQEVGKKLKVILEDGTEYPAIALGLDTTSDASLAQINLPENIASLPYAKPSTEINIGQYVFAMGHSGGFDINRGIVLRLGRVTYLEENSTRTDCVLIGGDSGGPLFDLAGRLVAIHSRVGTVTNSNTHVPVSVYKRQWEALEDGELLGDGTFANAGISFIGMQLLEKEGELEVIKVKEVSKSSKLGIEKGDILTQLNGEKTDSQASFLKSLKTLKLKEEGVDLALVFLRAGKKRSVEFLFND